MLPALGILVSSLKTRRSAFSSSSHRQLKKRSGALEPAMITDWAGDYDDIYHGILYYGIICLLCLWHHKYYLS